MRHDCAKNLIRIPSSDEDGTYQCGVCQRSFRLVDLQIENLPKITEEMLVARWGPRETVYAEDDQE